MPALVQNEKIEQAVDWQRVYTCKGQSTGDPTDLSGYSGEIRIYNAHGELLLTEPGTLYENTVTIALDEQDTGGLPAAANYTNRYVVDATHPSKPDYRIAEGRLTITPK